MNIYFNHSFTQTAKIVELLRDNPNKEKFHIVMSQDKENKYLSEVADVLEREPLLEGISYIAYLVDVCLRHKIDVFIPRKHMTLISKHRNSFEEIGVKVLFMGSDYVYELLNDKVKTYEDLKNESIVGIPTTYTITSLADFQEAYKGIVNEGNKACMKPISGIGGAGFKVIKESLTPLEELYITSSSSIARERIEYVLGKHEKVEPFMMSAFLEGEEFSIDCLAKNGELIIGIPRKKIDRYRQTIEYKPELMEIAKVLTKRYNLSYLYNVQVRFHKGKWYLIEINTRMSGGLYKSCLTGVNLPYEAIQLLVNDNNHPTATQPNEDIELYSKNSFGVKILTRG